MSGLAAIKRSWALVKPLRWQLAGPFVGLVVAQRLLDAGKGWLLTSMPPRCALVPPRGGGGGGASSPSSCGACPAGGLSRCWRGLAGLAVYCKRVCRPFF